MSTVFTRPRSSGIHLASMVSDIFGKAGQFILRSLLDGVTIKEIVERTSIARIKKKEALLNALHTHLSPVDRVLLEQHLEIILVIDTRVAEIDTEAIAGFVDRRDDLEILTSIPWIGVTSAVTILAEIGNYRDFPSCRKTRSLVWDRSFRLSVCRHTQDRNDHEAGFPAAAVDPGGSRTRRRHEPSTLHCTATLFG